MSVDIAISICFLVSFLYGWSQGFFAIALTLTCWIVAGLLSLNFAELGAMYLKPMINDPRLAIPAAGILIFFVTAFTCDKILTPIFDRVIRATSLSIHDRLLGAVIGIVTASILLVLLLDLTESSFKKERWWRKSEFIPVLKEYRKPIKRQLDKIIDTSIQNDSQRRRLRIA